MKQSPLLSACIVLGMLALPMAGCGRGDDPDLKASAGGEVLPGSVSDAMLPLDTVRSQPQLAPRADASGKPGASADKTGAADDDGSAAAAPGPGDAPAESIAPEPAGPATPGAE